MLKQLPFSSEKFQEAFVHRIIADQAVNVDCGGLSHAVRPGDRLVFNRGFQLRFGNNHYAGTLNVQPHPTSSYLGE